MKPAPRPERIGRRAVQWRTDENDLRELYAAAFGKECKRPLKISQRVLANLLCDFSALCTPENGIHE